MYKDYTCDQGQLCQYAYYMTKALNLHSSISLKNHIFVYVHNAIVIPH